MYNMKLIVDLGSPTTELDLKTDAPVSISLNIADIRYPDKRNGSYSKTIVGYGTKANDKKFEFIFDATSSLTLFDPNLKTTAAILHDDAVILEGYLQLKSIKEVLDNDTELREYELILVGNVGTIFTEMSDSKLTDLDFSEFDHTYNRTEQKNTWATSYRLNGIATAFAYGYGYLYPIIDYGFKQWGQDYHYHVEHLRPAIPAREYMVKIFEAYNKTWTSPFLDGSFFKRLYIPHNGETLSMSPANLANYEFYAGRLATSGVQNIPLSYIGGSVSGWKSQLNYGNLSSSNNILHLPNDDSTAPFNDAGGVYNTGTGVYTANKNGFITITGSLKFEAKLNFPATAVTCTGGTSVQLLLLKSVNGGTTWTVEGQLYYQQAFGNNVALTTSYQTATLNFNFGSIGIAGTNQLKVIAQINSVGGDSNPIFFLDAGSAAVTTGTASYDVRQLSGSYFKIDQTYKSLFDGNTCFMNDAIPADISQKDFVKGILNMFNLYMDIDKTNPNNYLIYPRDDFYAGGTTRDWTSKRAVSREHQWETYPMGVLDNKKLVWRYKSDTDYFNSLYQKEFNETYGQKTVEIINDFINGELIAEVLFSATPIVDNQQNSMIVPKIFSYENSQVKPVKHNIRILYYGGVKSSGNQWQYKDNSGTQVETTYPFTGMVDDPINNTVSIEFGTPNRVYYTANQYTYTDNNLYNGYYYRQTNEASDKDSKVVVGYFDVTATEIATFDFRDKIFIENSVYIAQKLDVDYLNGHRALVRAELLKLKTYNPYTPVTFAQDDVETNAGTDFIMGKQSQGSGNVDGAGNNSIAGSGISILSEGQLATGSGISMGQNLINCSVSSSTGVAIGDDCENCSMTNCKNCLIGPGCVNVKLNNCENVTVFAGTEDFVGNGLYDIEGIDEEYNLVNLHNDEGSLTTVTTDTTTTLDKKKYLVDATTPPGSPPGTDVLIQLLDAPFANFSQTIKKIDSTANTVTIQSSLVGVQIDGAGTYVLNNQYEFVTVMWSGSEWLIEAYG
jgi:hypothetical protein